MFVPESLRKQNELIRTLRKQLEATERELANQKWVFGKFLQSPTWKLTYPIRWIARQIRAVRLWMTGESDSSAEAPDSIVDAISRHTAGLLSDDSATEASGFDELKDLYTSLFRTNLQCFLTSNFVLETPRSDTPVISIILVLFNRAELTFACLRSICEIRDPALEVIIVDNASSDDTGLLLDRVRGATIIRNTGNIHFLRAVNQAAMQARGEFLLLLNNDAQLLPGAVEAGLATMQSSPDIGAVGGRIILLDGSLQEAGSIIWRDGSCLGYGRSDNPFTPNYMFRRDVDYCSGAFLLTPKAVWDRLNGFDEEFRPAYYEETDYCMRLRQNGLRVVYEPEAVILHYEFASSKSAAAATQIQSSHQRLFAKKHHAALQQHHTAGLNSILVARSRPAPRRILFIDDRVPHPWLGSGFPRARAILHALLKDGAFVTLYPLAILDEPWSSIYSDLPREVEVMTEFGLPLLEAFLRNRRDYYDTIVVSRPHNMHHLRPVLLEHPEWFEHTRILYDAEALFASRDLGLRQLMGEKLTEDEVRSVTREEVQMASEADCVIAVSELEKKAFLEHGVQSVHILGHAINPQPTNATYSERQGFLFVGAVHEEVSPNGDSLIWFLENVWPILRSRLDGIDLRIVGVIQSERIRALATGPVEILENLRDLSDVYNSARVFIAPTRYAAGIPHKIHEAAARGVPAVATSLLAQQLGWADGVHLSVADTAEAFAAKCAALYADETLWMRQRTNALAAIEEECAIAAFESALHKIMNLPEDSKRRERRAKERFADAGMDR